MELASTDSRRGRVLLVEDDELNRTLVGSFLESLGHEVVSVATGSAALATALEVLFDTTIIDQNLPDMDGIEVARQLRLKGDHTPRLIAISGDNSPGQAERFYDNGFQAFLAKPFSLRDLAAVVSGVEAISTESVAQTADGVLDQQYLRSLLRDLGFDIELMLDLAEIFHLQVADFLLVASDDPTGQLDALAHRLVGSSARLGLTGIADLARELERRVIAEADYETLMNELCERLPASTAALDEWIRRVAETLR